MGMGVGGLCVWIGVVVGIWDNTIRSHHHWDDSLRGEVAMVTKSDMGHL